MQGINGVNKIEVVVRVGERCSVADLHAIMDFFLRILDGVFRDVDAMDLNTGKHLFKVIQKKAFATAHVQNLVASFEAIVLYHGACDLFPAPFHVAIAAVVYPPVAIPVVKVPFLSQFCSLGFWILGIVDPGEVVPFCTFVYHRHEINIGHYKSFLISNKATDTRRQTQTVTVIFLLVHVCPWLIQIH